MTLQKTSIDRRSFLKKSVLTGGGLIISFSWSDLFAFKTNPRPTLLDEVTELNGFLKIAENGIVTIISPNPEGGQNVKTSMPMIVAEELDVDWKNVIVEQAPLNTKLYTRQFIGGSQAIRTSWKTLRTAGATARQMLREAAAAAWAVPVDEIITEAGMLHHKKSGKSAGYGAMATAAAKIPVPGEVKLKDKKDFKIIGTSKKNVDVPNILSGKPLFGIDTQREGMLIAMIVHPPAFGMKLKSVDDSSARTMPGVKDVFPVKVLNDDQVREFFDTCTFTEVVAIVGKTTWEVMNAKKKLKIEWEPITEHTIKRNAFGGRTPTSVTIPAGLESTTDHKTKMAGMVEKPANVVRKDGDPETAFKNAAQIIERTYTAPFLAHNCMEPMNFFAHVTNEKADLAGPMQKAELTERTLAARLGIPVEKIDIQLTRLGGGFGRRSYAHWLIEAALISQKINAPVKLIYTREDDMTSGIYRPTYTAKYRAALDANKNLIAFHINAGGIPESPLAADSFPAGAVENYLAESWTLNSNITTGSFRAPKSNFIAVAEQCFLDEVAEAAGKDPFTFRLELLERVMKNPVGKDHDYDANRYAAVLKHLKEKSGWGKAQQNISRGLSIYYCHNTYAAQVLDVKFENGRLVIPRVCCVIDCGIVVNPDAATNLAEGAIVDGIGNALYGGITFKEGRPEKNNFNLYRMIRHNESPRAIDVHFVPNDFDPTGMGEPAFPPVFGALANALYKATGKRFYEQPFISQLNNSRGT
jgi:isoquinoline 1-oxidoreductase beta subunit